MLWAIHVENMSRPMFTSLSLPHNPAYDGKYLYGSMSNMLTQDVCRCIVSQLFANYYNYAYIMQTFQFL